MQPVSLADELRLEPAAGGARRGRLRRRRGPEPRRRRARARSAQRDRLGRRRRCGSRSTKRIPVAGGMARRLGRRRGGAAAARRARRRRRRRCSREIAAALGADVPSQVRAGRALATGAGERLEPAAAARALGVLVLPVDAALSTPAVVRARPTGSASAHAGRAGGRPRERLRADDVAVGRRWRQRPRARRALAVPGDRRRARRRAPRRARTHDSCPAPGPTVLGLFAGEGGARAGARRRRARSPGAGPPRSRPSPCRRAGARWTSPTCVDTEGDAR